ncbi:TonB-dependent receptor plug domain-containing protein [Sphingomonas sp.]|jgi:iron complex outermembrane receptor protein|uniref:TonB-dependent receptor plug domain-containing protein n=1 Tax=Sphingomonas sp. TaxID=28214 RepID=UPI002D7FF2CF|nr:TonB-dependent receptor [Sphingomonas sp.]HEU0045224.1 TonB-dependent receptor [Sphingomonas sp.]
MRRTAISLLLSCTALVASPAWGQATAPEPTIGRPDTPAEQAAQDDTTRAASDVVVIGTRRTDRTVTDSASPVDVIGAEELQAQPAANMLDIVRNLVPSFFIPQNTISDASTFVRPPSLRGLGADQILVMVNGKRYNRSALVQVYSGADTALSYGSQGSDIANIPSIAIGSLQILRDGATAQYGSDAIAGVINYQLRENSGIELQALYGQTYEGDGERYQIAGNVGFKLGERGFVNVSGEYFNEKGTSRGATRPLAVVLATVNPGVANRIPNFPGPAQIWGTSPADGFKLFLNSAYEFTDAAKAYLTVNYAQSSANQSFNYRSPIGAPTPLAVNDGSGTAATRSPGANGAFNTIYTTACPAGNATCPAGGFVRNGGATFNFNSIYPGGFTPRFIGEVEQIYGTGGLKGDLGNFTYDLSATLARNSLSLSMTDSLSASFGPQSQTSFFFGDLIQTERNLNADFTYALEAGFASPITLSAGAEHRREQYETTVGDLQSYAAGPFARQPLYDLVVPGVYAPALNATGGQIVATQSPAASGYGGVSPIFAGKNSQESYGIYAAAEADIVPDFSAGIAGRFEDYETFGSTWVGKFNAIYRATDVTSLRFTVGTGFHAPSPGQNNTQILTTNFLGGTQVQTGTYPVTSDIAQFYGATVLRPEKSLNFGAGIVIDPKNGFTLTIDAYTIKVRDRIGISQNFNVTAANVASLPSLASVGVGGVVNYFTNGFDTRTSGVDVVSTYRTRLLDDPFSVTFAYNYNKSTVTEFDPAVISAAQRFNISNLPPKHRINLSANWQIGNFTINARENFYSSWANQLEYPGQTFGGKFLTDLDISYTLAERFTLTVGANNLFDTYPDRIAPTTTNPIYALTNSLADGQIYPRSGGPFGINGGFYYARVRIKY